MRNLIDISCYPVVKVLNLLLKDKTTKRNIVWATDNYEEYGEGYLEWEQIDQKALLNRPEIICPRIQKSQETQAKRTKKKAEVFTPAWVCNKMNNYCDKDWFEVDKDEEGIFNTENDDHTWKAKGGHIEFPEGKSWKKYVDSRRLEITCGEAPYLVSRYDTSTGEQFESTKERIGMLDRKMRVVNENANDKEEWEKWTIRAFEASYGYEYQGDNVLLARINMLNTFTDYYEEQWGKEPDDKLLHQIAKIIAWNIWQMDGIKGTVPFSRSYEQITFETMENNSGCKMTESISKSCKVYNWRSKFSIKYSNLKEA